MKTHIPLTAALAIVCFTAHLFADEVDTRNGARIVGKITKIDGGVIFISTDFAGDLKIKQDSVVAISTDRPVAVRLASGTRFDGTIANTNGSLQIAGPDGTITTTVGKVAASWPAGAVDPAVIAQQEHWKYEATADMNGTSGNHNQLGTEFGFTAQMAGPHDSLKFYTDYNRQVTDGTKSADRFKGGVDYSNNFVDGSSWFVRDEAGFDRIMDIRFFETAAAGYGYDVVKTKADLLTARVGLGYEYTGYSTIATPTISSAAGDLEINHDLKLGDWELANKLTYVPTFANVSNYFATQDSFFQIPLTNPAWKLRIGVSNNYDSMPPKGIEKLDTTYYTRLILDFE